VIAWSNPVPHRHSVTDRVKGFFLVSSRIRYRNRAT
jgi:hypothetical protein